MQLRRAGGRVRFLPADLAAWPAVVTGLALLVKARVITNDVTNGPRTVRVVLLSPDNWLQDLASWLGFLVLAVGVALVAYAARRPDPHRRATAVRYPAFAAAALLLAFGVLLSAYDASGHVTDIGSGGAQWRFQVEPRTRLVNDVTTVFLVVAAGACYALSFGAIRWADFEAFAARQATRDRVPATMTESASTSSTSPPGEPAQNASRRGKRPPDGS